MQKDKTKDFRWDYLMQIITTDAFILNLERLHRFSWKSVDTYISESHFLWIIHAIYLETALVDEVVQGRISLDQKFIWIGK